MKQYILLILSFLMAGRMLAEDEQVLVFRNETIHTFDIIFPHGRPHAC